jgi:hypothetical protein
LLCFALLCFALLCFALLFICVRVLVFRGEQAVARAFSSLARACAVAREFTAAPS